MLNQKYRLAIQAKKNTAEAMFLYNSLIIVEITQQQQPI